MASAQTTDNTAAGIKTPVAILCMVLALIAGFVVGNFRPFSRKGPAVVDAQVRYKVPVGKAAVRGPANAKVTIVEFSDYQCPFCAKVEPTIAEVLKKYDKNIRLAFKHNPLPFHPLALPAARASLAVREQGDALFWKYHEGLFGLFRKAQEEKVPVAEQALYDLVGTVGADAARVKTDLEKNQARYDAEIQADQALARQVGASGTPAFFINGRLLSGAQPKESFEKIIDEELAFVDALLKGDVSHDAVYETLMQNAKTAAEPPPTQKPAAQGKAAAPQAPAEDTTVHRALVGDAPVLGPQDAKVTIVEWSDFQCPYCSLVVSPVKELLKQFPKDVRFVFKQFPLSFHDKAHLAAQAALAAKAQGKFWPYHDKLFENQKMLDRADLERYAKEVGLNLPKFREALDKGTYKAKVDAEMAEGMQAGVQGTPSLFVNGIAYSGPRSAEALAAKVKQAIAEVEKWMAEKKIPAAKVYDAIMAEAKSAPTAAAAKTPEVPDERVVVEPGDGPAWGNKNAPVTLVVFSDFECPYCSKVVPTLHKIQDAYKDKVRIVWRNFPLPFHHSAGLAAEAALAAHAQGKFWQYHDKLFENQRTLDQASLERYAEQLGLDMASFKQALQDHRYQAAVQKDVAYGNSLGGMGTPTVFINGRKIAGAYPYEVFDQKIKDALAEQAPKKKK